jgi:hypothetical protein
MKVAAAAGRCGGQIWVGRPPVSATHAPDSDHVDGNLGILPLGPGRPERQRPAPQIKLVLPRARSVRLSPDRYWREIAMRRLAGMIALSPI